jgi:tetratricopeptide (TPR) repeat protein
VSAAIEQALEAMDARRLDEAVAHLHAALAQEPDNAGARFLLATTYSQQNNLDAALAEFRRIPADHRHAELVHIQIAGIHLSQNRPGEAEHALRECLERFPRSVAARQPLLDILGLQLRQREMLAVLDDLWRLAESRGELDKVWVLAKSMHVRLMRPDEEELWPTLQAFAKSEPDNLDTQIAISKLKLMINAEVEDAAQTLERCLERIPDHVEAIAGLTAHYVEQADIAAERVEELLGRWSSKSPDAEYWQVLGDWQQRAGEVEKALASYRQAQASDPSQWRTVHKIGLLLVRLGKQSGEASSSLEEEGERMLEEAATLKERRAMGAEHFEYLQKWLGDPASAASPRSSGIPVGDFVKIAEFCADVRCDIDALRWCDLIQQVAPGEAKCAAIKKRIMSQNPRR